MKWRTFKFVFKFTTFVNGLSISDILALSLVNQLPVNRCLPKFKKKVLIFQFGALQRVCSSMAAAHCICFLHFSQQSGHLISLGGFFRRTE